MQLKKSLDNNTSQERMQRLMYAEVRSQNAIQRCVRCHGKMQQSCKWDTCRVGLSQFSQSILQKLQQNKKAIPVDGLVRPSGWNQWQRFQMAEKPFYGPWPWRFVFLLKTSVPSPRKQRLLLLLLPPVRGADARNAALGRITQLESDWNTRIMKNSLSNSAAAAWLRSKFSFLLHTFLLLRHSKMSSHEFKCKSVRARASTGAVFSRGFDTLRLADYDSVHCIFAFAL